MQQLSSQITALAVAVALLAAPAATFGQAPAPSRDANVWGWHDHQPTQAEVVQKEKAAGVVASPSQRDSSAATVDELYRQILGRAHT
jgi:outer membrane biogenesis lipoprotein LolB